MQMELRDLQSQTKLHERRRPSDMMELVRLEGRSYQVLYSTAGALCASDASHVLEDPAQCNELHAHIFYVKICHSKR